MLRGLINEVLASNPSENLEKSSHFKITALNSSDFQYILAGLTLSKFINRKSFKKKKKSREIAYAYKINCNFIFALTPLCAALVSKVKGEKLQMS